MWRRSEWPMVNPCRCGGCTLCGFFGDAPRPQPQDDDEPETVQQPTQRSLLELAAAE